MSLINQQGMFQGTPTLNPLPYVQIAIQARQRKAAREDAIDKYYQKLPDTINDKGVRDQEVPIINDYRDKIFEFGLKNKEALRNPKLDRGAAQHGLNKLMNEAKGVARLSQDAAKEDLEIGKLWLSKDNRWVVDDDEFIAANQRHNLPVTDPNFKKVDIPLILQGRPFDQTAFRKELKDFKYSEGTPKIEPHPKDPLMEVVTSNPVLGEDTKASIYNFAADKYHSNRSFRKKIENDLAQTGQLPILQDVFKKTFGKEIESDEDIAAAYTISQLPTSQTRAKVITNKDAVMDRQLDDWNFKNDKTFRQQKLMEGLRQGNREKLLGIRKKYELLSEEEKLADVDAFIQDEIDEAKDTKTELGTLGKPIKANPMILESLAIKDPVTNKDITPSGISYLYNGNFKIIYPSENIEDKEITRKEYKSTLVNKLFNTKTKIGQISNQSTKGKYD